MSCSMLAVSWKDFGTQTISWDFMGWKVGFGRSPRILWDFMVIKATKNSDINGKIKELDQKSFGKWWENHLYMDDRDWRVCVLEASKKTPVVEVCSWENHTKMLEKTDFPANHVWRHRRVYQRYLRYFQLPSGYSRVCYGKWSRYRWFIMIYLLNIVIFQSYVKFPEGIWLWLQLTKNRPRFFAASPSWSTISYP